MNLINSIKQTKLHLIIPTMLALNTSCKNSQAYMLALNTSCKNSQALFQENGSDWDKNGTATWEFSNGVLNGSITRGNSFLMTNQKYDNYILELEFNPDEAINSGIYIHCAERIINTEKCYEVNISDNNATPANRTGSIVPI